jgi:hypothetical protein
VRRYTFVNIDLDPKVGVRIDEVKTFDTPGEAIEYCQKQAEEAGYVDFDPAIEWGEHGGMSSDFLYLAANGFDRQFVIRQES